ncbi:hypothetical protein LPU83_pLPU83d_0794 (plasmid) [Rhizobium favelukesii]|uniref:Uncharacterized protein n=1 Tax=Rhizobium favelukesii TaxID=348824 RepID=W6RN21_9HYPH|nr:hypothetical protein LPU83_pLPU83d_0794 [Rhizobium favelukesii]
MSPEGGNRRAKDMRENKELKRDKRISKIAPCVSVETAGDAHVLAYCDFTSPEKPATARRLSAQPITDWKK